MTECKPTNRQRSAVRDFKLAFVLSVSPYWPNKLPF